MKTEIADAVPTPVNSVLIESVKNGFIVYENFYRDPMREPGVASHRERLVFNTKDQLNEYINKTLE